MDLGDSILLPGLVNAHCHLDYTGMAGVIPPQRAFTDWIKLMLAAKAEWNYSEFAASWIAGANMLLRTGTTTVADFEAVPELLPEVWTATPLRVISFLELTGVRFRRDPRAILREALGHMNSLPRHARCSTALGPHAPYSTPPDVLRLGSRMVRKHRLPFSIHLSESLQEFEMFTQADGPMYHWLRRNNRDMSDCGLGSPVRHLERHGALSERLLAVHVNYLARGDATLLARKKVSVVHCPRSHVYFAHKKFPYARLARAKVNICLGTDSLATVIKRRQQLVELSMFAEMRSFLRAHPRVTPETVLEMATMNGARALGFAGEAGELSPGARADLIAIPFDGEPSEAAEAVVHHRSEVSASMIDGRWVLPLRTKR